MTDTRLIELNSSERLDEESIKALYTLIETAVMLKESGLLDMLRVVAEKSEELVMLLGNEVSIQRGMGLFNAVQRGIESVDADDIREAKHTVEAMTTCSIKALAATKVDEAQPKGLIGMLSALRDKDVQTGLSFLLALAKNLGRCIRSSRDRQ